MTEGNLASAVWQPVSREQAMRHPLHGVGGWLAVLLALSVLGVVFSFIVAVDESQYMTALLNMSSDGGLRALVIAYFILLWLSPLYLSFAIALAFQLNASFPAQMRIALWLGIAAAVVNALLVGKLTDVVSIPRDEVIYAVVGGAVGIGVSALLLWYYAASVRVNVTYRHRIRRNDPHGATLSDPTQPAPASAGGQPVWRTAAAQPATPAPAPAPAPAVPPAPAAPATPAGAPSRTVETRLQELKRLRDGGLIDEETYRERQAAILKDL